MRIAQFLRRIVIALAVAVAPHAPAWASELPADPLNSPMWREMATAFLSDGQIAFDPRVKIIVPSNVEDQAQVPVTADARALAGVTKLVVFADLNPIQHVLTLRPQEAEPYVSFRMKVEQGTPIRAAARTADGVWHVGGVFLDAAGGGCSAPAKGRKDISWSDTLGQAQGRVWQVEGDIVRARFRVRHPMDTGLAIDNTPAYYIETVKMRSKSGVPLATLDMFEPVGEDPTLTLLLRLPVNESALEIEGRDNNGAMYRSRIPAPWRQSHFKRDTTRSDGVFPRRLPERRGTSLGSG